MGLLFRRCEVLWCEAGLLRKNHICWNGLLWFGFGVERVARWDALVSSDGLKKFNILFWEFLVLLLEPFQLIKLLKVEFDFLFDIQLLCYHFTVSLLISIHIDSLFEYQNFILDQNKLISQHLYFSLFLFNDVVLMKVFPACFQNLFFLLCDDIIKLPQLLFKPCIFFIEFENLLSQLRDCSVEFCDLLWHWAKR